MQHKLTTSISLILTAVVFFALVLLNNQLLSPLRLDLTENQVYSLSKGSKQVLADIDEPLNLYFFFSDKATKNMTGLRNYANRVESLLTEYQTIAKGKLNLQIIDPQPFSEQEDQANQYGLTGATIGAAGEAVYMGLAATNAIGEQKVIAFFDPKQESFLEYEISKLIHQLSNTKPVKVTLLSDLSIAGGQNPMTGQADPAWTFYTQLQQLYQVELLGSDISALPEDTDLLVLVHPKELNETLLYAIDQYAMQGGKLLVFVDPHNESDPLAMMAGAMGANGSSLERLFSAWGLSFDSEHVLLDAMAGLDIRTQAGGVTRHFGFIGLGAEQLDRDDITTTNLEVINGASFGTFSKLAGASTQWMPLMHSTVNADLMPVESYAMTRDPDELARKYQSKNRQYALAGRLMGKAKSAFESAAEGENEADFKSSTSALNVLVVGDTDLLADRFWVQQANFFGQTIFTPFANNGDFVTNSVENLSGSDALISIRSRGTFARPFIKVDELTVIAEQKFREQEQILQQQLDETEQQLIQLQNQQGEGAALAVSPEQQQAIDAFVQKKIQIRKALREVRHQLDKDIETLGSWLKFINIALAPLALVLFLMLCGVLLRTKSNPAQRGLTKEAK
ncbi:GldG family protein [Paraglaciecola hydrolytica]|uniref:ABC transporter n=1 Tax=Paraglaciecola hydrolytica TaxID=1799789 RepID=A0A136A0F8_9ALTE|nr:Gldg family protein [Paraglaciecola hydrolytica]KXI28738.1 ABC transporter [Paraglaciecola hydrolytica]